MSDGRRQRIEDIFHAAGELEPNERSVFLDQACGGDELMCQEIESLLAQRDKPPSPLKVSPVAKALRILSGNTDVTLVGRVIDHYHILSRLGAGGMGEVYVAEDERLGRRVALKLLPPIVPQDEHLVLRLQREARTASALNHPNIITIHDIGQPDSLHFIAMEFIEGETLRQKMQEQLPIRDVLNIAIQVASGLAAAHQAGIIHRDIKPENIMFSSDGYVKILDFGIAKFKDRPALVSIPQSEATVTTQASAVAGTLSYMSPEQARGESLDARTDIFSLGVLLFEMVTGRRPFEAETQAEVRHAILNNEARPLSAFRRNVPRDLERIISKALKKNRDQRYQSAKEMLADLREFDRLTGDVLDATQRANRMLRQYLSIYAVDKRALVPITKLRFINRYSNLDKGERGRELLRKSLQSGLLKSGALLLSLAILSIFATAALSLDETWDEVVLRDGHTRAARQTAFSPDGRLLVSVGEDSKVIVWDFSRRMPLATLTDHTKTVTSVAFAPDGKYFATGSEDGKVIIWDPVSFKKIVVLSEGQGMIIAVAFSPDGALLAGASHDSSHSIGRVILWDAGQWYKTRELAATVGKYGRLMFAPDSRRLISSGGHKWDVNTGQEVQADFREANWVAASRDGTHLLTMASGGDVGEVELSRHRSTSHPKVHQDSGRAADFSPDGRFAATGSDDIVLWDVATMTKLARFEYAAVVWHVAFSPDGRTLVSTHGDGAILVWDVADRKQTTTLGGHSGAVRGVVISPDGKFIASAAEDRSVILWNTETRRKEAVLLGADSRLTGVAFSPDGKQVASSQFGPAITVWDLGNPQNKSAFEVGPASYCVAISPDNRWVATTSGVYNRADGHPIVDFEKQYRPFGWQMYGVAFSPDGRWLAGASPNNNFITLFDTRNWELRENVRVQDATFISISFSHDSKHLVTGDDEGTVRLWAIEPLRQVALLGRHTSRIKSVTFSPDSKQVASAGDDNTIRLWDVIGRRLIREIGTHTRPALSVAFAPDGKQIVSGEHDNSVRLYTRHRVLWGYRLD